jgi:hypothetical protein
MMLARLLFRTKAKPQNIGAMMQRLGIEASNDLVYNGGHTFDKAMRACLACSRTGDCRAWLDAQPESVEAAPSFCPNAARFQAMRICGS